MSEETKAKPAAEKKAKPPAPEEKPFTEFMEADFVPALKTACHEAGLTDMTLTFDKKTMPIQGLEDSDAYWQVEGQWQGGKRQFNVYYFDESIGGQKGFSCATDGYKASTLESFMIDERKVSLDLMVMYVLQRLNSEKWLGSGKN